MSRSAPRVVVVGSLNVDYIASVDKLPAPGETVAARALTKRFGGKGANQAVAAARQGAKVSLVGCVGTDADGPIYRGRLEKERIDTRGITRSATSLTGTALIAVDRKAENTIIVAAGANRELTPHKIQQFESLITSSTAILLQFEIPTSANLAVLKLANRAGIPVSLNPSPLQDNFPWTSAKLDSLIVNAGEARAIFGLPAENFRARRGAWAKALQKYHIGSLLITRGAEPTVCFSAGDYFEVATLRVKPIDTVGAGDAFAGTFMACRAQGQDLLSAIRMANCAGALTTLKIGAQEAIPNRAATQRALRRLM
jgi:ribokinase